MRLPDGPRAGARGRWREARCCARGQQALLSGRWQADEWRGRRSASIRRHFVRKQSWECARAQLEPRVVRGSGMRGEAGGAGVSVCTPIPGTCTAPSMMAAFPLPAEQAAIVLRPAFLQDFVVPLISAANLPSLIDSPSAAATADVQGSDGRTVALPGEPRSRGSVIGKDDHQGVEEQRTSEESATRTLPSFPLYASRSEWRCYPARPHRSRRSCSRSRGRCQFQSRRGIGLRFLTRYGARANPHRAERPVHTLTYPPLVDCAIQAAE